MTKLLTILITNVQISTRTKLKMRKTSENQQKLTSQIIHVASQPTQTWLSNTCWKIQHESVQNGRDEKQITYQHSGELKTMSNAVWMMLCKQFGDWKAERKFSEECFESFYWGGHSQISSDLCAGLSKNVKT